MLNDTQKAKVGRFLDDVVMSDSVFKVIQSTFLKAKPNRDVYQLAAERLAISMLEEAWRDLEKCRIESESEKSQAKQVGM